MNRVTVLLAILTLPGTAQLSDRARKLHNDALVFDASSENKPCRTFIGVTPSAPEPCV